MRKRSTAPLRVPPSTSTKYIFCHKDKASVTPAKMIWSVLKSMNWKYELWMNFECLAHLALSNFVMFQIYTLINLKEIFQYQFFSINLPQDWSNYLGRSERSLVFMVKYISCVSRAALWVGQLTASSLSSGGGRLNKIFRPCMHCLIKI